MAPGSTTMPSRASRWASGLQKYRHRPSATPEAHLRPHIGNQGATRGQSAAPSAPPDPRDHGKRPPEPPAHEPSPRAQPESRRSNQAAQAPSPMRTPWQRSAHQAHSRSWTPSERIRHLRRAAPNHGSTCSPPRRLRLAGRCRTQRTPPGVSGGRDVSGRGVSRVPCARETRNYMV